MTINFIYIFFLTNLSDLTTYSNTHHTRETPQLPPWNYSNVHTTITGGDQPFKIKESFIKEYDFNLYITN